MQTYRKKPVEVQAVQWPLRLKPLKYGDSTGFVSSAWVQAEKILEWLDENHADADPFEDAVDGPCLVIRTLEGEMKAKPGDWIIREPFATDDRKFYPCKPDIFAATYEAV